MPKTVRLYLTFTDGNGRNLLRERLSAFFDGTSDIKIDFVLNPVHADILVTDTPRAFADLSPVNGQIFAVTHRHEHCQESHFRVLGRHNPIRNLVTIVREKAGEKLSEPTEQAVPQLIVSETEPDLEEPSQTE